MNGKYHIIAAALTEGESQANYQNLLSSVINACNNFQLGLKGQFAYGMSDHARQIRAAYMEVIPGITTLTCFSHFSHIAFEPNSGGLWRKVANKDNIEVIKGMLVELSVIRDEGVFRAGLEMLYRQLHKLREGPLAAHIHAEYGHSTMMRWSNAFKPDGMPKTNNHTEGKNRDIKENCTDHQKSNLNWFLCKELTSYLRHESIEDKSFAMHPDVKHDTWRSAVEFKGSLGYELSLEGKDGSIFVPSSDLMSRIDGVPTTRKVKVVLKEFNELLRIGATPIKVLHKYKNFTEFINIVKSFYVISPYPDDKKTPHVHFACTCPFFCQRRVCKHVVGHGAALGLVHVPVDKDPRLVAIKKRGRPKKAA